MNSVREIPEKLPMKIKVAYGSMEFTNTLAYVAFISFGMYFFTDIIGMNPGVAGTIVAIGSVANAIGGPIAGVLSDNCRSKYGRRRPFLLAIAVPFGIISWLLFTDFGFSATGTIVYFSIIVVIFFIMLCFLDVPFTSLGAEITKDYDERTNLNTVRSFFCQLASIIGGAATISIAAYIGVAAGNDKVGWSIMAGIFGLIGTGVLLAGWRGTRGYEQYREDNEGIKPKDFLDAFKNKAFLYTLLLYSSGIGAYTVALAVQVYYFTYCLEMSEGQITIILVIYNIAAILWLPLIPFISKKLSKKAAWVIMMGIWGIATILMVVFLKPGSFMGTCVLMAVAAAGSMVAYTVGWAMLPDCIEVDEYKTGRRREGLYYGILTIIQKGSGAVITWITGLVLAAIGYDGTAAIQAASTIEGIKYMFLFGALIFIVLSYVFVALYPITRKNHDILLEAVEKKRNGEEFDASEIDKLIK